jgi:hypothetical protein
VRIEHLDLGRSPTLPLENLAEIAHRLMSSGPVARFEDDHGSVGRPLAGVRVELRIDRHPALP